MTQLKRTITALALLSLPVGLMASRRQDDPRTSAVERGRYLVNVIGCSDCHTPKKMGPQGPELDESRLLSGHPEGSALPAPPAGRAPGSPPPPGTSPPGRAPGASAMPST